MAKMPAFQFYPADWRKSPDVQALSFFDRGVWFEILCLMHESEERGRLMLSGRPMSDDALTRILGLTKSQLKKSLGNILGLGVAIRDDDGALCSRRMMRDEEIRKVRTACGGLGGNPNLVNQNANQTPKQIPTPSSSSSSSSSEEDLNPVSVPPLREIFVGTVEAEIAKRMEISTLPSKLEWHKAAEWAHHNGFTADHFLECYDLLKSQNWRDGPVKPSIVTDNLPNLGKLRAEIEKQNGKSGGKIGTGEGHRTTERALADIGSGGTII
jgi:hypothetical protein